MRNCYQERGIVILGPWNTLQITHPKQRSWLLQSVRWHVHRTPLVRKLGAFSFPGLQKQGGPHNVEDVEEQDAPVTCYLSSVGQEESYDTKDCGCDQPFGVHPQPGEVHSDLYTKVLADVVCKLKEITVAFMDITKLHGRIKKKREDECMLLPMFN